jgi:NAD+ kinase
MMRAHKAHEQTLREARRTLRACGARATFRRRSAHGSASSFDLVITIGGDGTLLWASQMIGEGRPVLAVNSAPDHSVGYFCATSRAGFADTLADALAGRLAETSLTRMRVAIDGRLAANRVLNDVLFSHHCPAATSRYRIRLRKRAEEHKSSGVWIATAAGSTAAIRSAGGHVVPIASEQLQYVVREPYPIGRTPYRLLRGTIAPGERLEIQSNMRTGRLYFDGPHVWRPVDIGARITFERSNEPLLLLGFQGRRTRS